MEKPKHGVFSLVRQEQRITLQTRKYQMGSNDFWMSTICSSIFVFYIIVKFIHCEKANLPPDFYITLVTSKLSKRFRQIYVAFSKNLNLNKYMFQIPNYTYLIKFEKCSSWYFVTKIVQANCENIFLVIEKNFFNSRLKAENLQNFWDH